MKYYEIWWDYEINTEIWNRKWMNIGISQPPKPWSWVDWYPPGAYPTSNCWRTAVTAAAWARMKVHFPKRSPMSFLWADGHMESMDPMESMVPQLTQLGKGVNAGAQCCCMAQANSLSTSTIGVWRKQWRKWVQWVWYPLVNCHITMENHHF